MLRKAGYPFSKIPNRMKKLLFTLLSAAVAVSAAAGDKNYLRYVDPYIGAGGHGHVFVGACVPFGAIQVGPQNIFKGWDWCSATTIRTTC